MVRDIVEGRGSFPGWKVTPDNKVELDYNHFKKQFGSKANFAKFFRNVLSGATPLNNKVTEVRRALDLMNVSIKQEAAAFQKALVSYELTHVPSMRYANRPAMFHQLKPYVMDVLKGLRRPFVAKWNLRFQVEFKKWDSEDTMVTTLFPKAVATINKREFYERYRQIENELETIIENMDARNGSGWYPVRIRKAWLNVYDHNPLSGKSYFPIPTYEDSRCGLVNIKNDDNRCFFWSMTAAKVHMEKVDSGKKDLRSWNTTDRYKKQFQKYWSLLDEDTQYGIMEEGMDMQTYCAMERIFHAQIYVMQMEIDGDKCGDPYPIYRPTSQYKHKIYLLRAIKTVNDEELCHYVWIKDPNHFVSRTVSAHNRVDQICFDCFQFVRKEEMASHQCGVGFQTKIYCPNADVNGAPPTLQFKGWRKSMEVPVMIIADFEATNKKICVRKGEHSMKTSVQECASFAFLPVPTIMNKEGNQYVPDPMEIYSGPDAAIKFLDRVVQYCRRNYWKKIHKHIDMKTLTVKQQQEYDNAEECCICDQPGDWEATYKDVDSDGNRCEVERNRTKVRHHNHFNGKFIGAAHSDCNIKASQWPNVSVIFHNLKGYDSHFLLKALKPHHGSARILADNGEKVKSMSLWQHVMSGGDKRTGFSIKFIDSFAFLSASLDKLSSLAIDFNEDEKDQAGFGLCHNLPWTTAYLNESIPKTGIPKALLKKYSLKKGFFPYEWFDDLSKLDLPLFDGDGQFLLAPEDFHSSLSSTVCQDLVHKAAWSEMMCRGMEFKTFRDYHDFYLRMDVLLLGDIFQRFRTTCLKAPNCGQDPCHYYGTPSLVFDSFLKHNTMDIELMTDTAMYQKCHRDGMRGGISYWRRYLTIANNEMHPQYDPSLPRTEIIDMDATSLYPWAGRQRLPTGDFKLLGECPDVWEYILRDLPEDQGYYVWADLHLPVNIEEWLAATPAKYHGNAVYIKKHYGGNLHDYQSNYPVLVENKVVPSEFLSEHQQQLYEATSGQHHPTNKLINDLLPKKRYMIHYLTLRQALETGWVITKIHERLEFRQEYVCKDFIDFCVQLRAQAKNPVEKSLQKMNMNSLIGKFIENVMKHSDFRLWHRFQEFKVNERIGRLKDNWYILNDDLVMAELHKKNTELNKPIMMGIAVYDISKLLMSHLWYYLQHHYGKKIELCGTDTDSLIFCVETESWEKDAIYHNQFSVFPEDHPLRKNSRFSDEVTKKLVAEGIDTSIGIFDLGERYVKSIPGFFKPDHDRIIEAAAMRAKMYSFKRNTQAEMVWVSRESGKWVEEPLDEVFAGTDVTLSSDFVSSKKHRDICKAKGIPSGVVDEQFTHAYYKNIILNPLDNADEEVTFSSLKSERHAVYQIRQTKASLRPVDDKRYSTDGISSFPYGHFSTVK